MSRPFSLLHPCLRALPLWLTVLPLYLSIFAQPPHPKGQGKEFLKPLPPSTTTRNVCSRLSVREFNGQCTSTRDPTWGQAQFAQFSYRLRTSSRVPSGRSLPSAREISNIVFDQRVDTSNSHGLNQLFVFFGQFLDHNFVATPEQQNERLDIPVPPSDRFLSERFLPFKRSMRARADSGRSVRPLNALPSAVDLSAVYGSNQKRNNELVEFDDAGSLSGKLKTSPGNLLPLNTGGFVNSPDTSARFFLAGDHRANEHPALTAIHTLFLREHNTLTDEIRRTIPSLPSSLVYQYARLLNVAQFQKIVFEEFYPAIVGSDLPLYRGFRPNVNPTLSDIFIGAAFRIGHTMVDNEIPRRGPNGRLPSVRMSDILFRPASRFSSSELDNVIRGTALTRAQEVDAMVVDALRNSLFKNVRGEEGFDLVSLNIQRGRDHALPKFNDLRSMFGIPRARTFRDISSNPSTASKLSRAYNGKINNVEAFVGLLAEDRFRGAGMGRTMIAVWDREFRLLRDGDQFFYARTSRFPDIIRRDLIRWVRKLEKRGGVTFRDIIVRNSGVKGSQLPSGNIFKMSGGNKPPPPASPLRMSPTARPRPPKSNNRSPICSNVVCCAGSCGACRETGCRARSGGPKKCCESVIRRLGSICDRRIADGCIRPQPNLPPRAPAPTPICTNTVCCAGKCGKCGGLGCGNLPGGARKCCEDGIFQSGPRCSSKIIDGCIRPRIRISLS